MLYFLTLNISKTDLLSLYSGRVMYRVMWRIVYVMELNGHVTDDVTRPYDVIVVTKCIAQSRTLRGIGLLACSSNNCKQFISRISCRHKTDKSRSKSTNIMHAVAYLDSDDI